MQIKNGLAENNHHNVEHLWRHEQTLLRPGVTSFHSDSNGGPCDMEGCLYFSARNTNNNAAPPCVVIFFAYSRTTATRRHGQLEFVASIAGRTIPGGGGGTVDTKL